MSVLFAKKRPFNKTANFLISTEKNKSSRKGEEILGKLRSNENKERYFLYNEGENPKNSHKIPIQMIRNEHMAVQYKYVPCAIGVEDSHARRPHAKEGSWTSNKWQLLRICRQPSLMESQN